jgi:hypothetical protein
LQLPQHTALQQLLKLFQLGAFPSCLHQGQGSLLSPHLTLQAWAEVLKLLSGLSDPIVSSHQQALLQKNLEASSKHRRQWSPSHEKMDNRNVWV